MNELRQVLALVLDLASKQIGSLDDETMRALTQLIQRATQKLGQQNELEEAEQEQAQVADKVAPEGEVPNIPSVAGQIPQVDPAPHESSNINGFRYDPKTQELLVKFQGKYPQQNGPTYSYSGVPPYIYDVFSRGAVAPKTSGKNAWHRWRKGKAPSHGASMYALIKQAGYKYRKVG